MRVSRACDSDEWHNLIAAEAHLPPDAARQLREIGFVVMPGPAMPGGCEQLSNAYDRAVAMADPADVHVGKTRSSTRINDFVNRGSEFDAFDAENGATRFVPGSHLQSQEPSDVMDNPQHAHAEQVLACAPAGAIIIFNASVWHGHGANQSDRPRRSIQAHFCRRDARAAPDDHARRMRPATLRRISDLAKYVLNV